MMTRDLASDLMASMQSVDVHLIRAALGADADKCKSDFDAEGREMDYQSACDAVLHSISGAQ